MNTSEAKRVLETALICAQQPMPLRDMRALFAEEVAPYLRDLWTDTGHAHHWWPERLGGHPTPVTPGASATEGTPTQSPTTATTKKMAVTI